MCSVACILILSFPLCMCSRSFQATSLGSGPQHNERVSGTRVGGNLTFTSISVADILVDTDYSTSVSDKEKIRNSTSNGPIIDMDGPYILFECSLYIL